MRKELLNQWLERMVKQGYRHTPQRKEPLDIVLSFQRPFAPLEIYERMEKKFRGLSYGTVYQNLKLFRQLRIIDTLAVGNEVRYRLRERPQPQLHLICLHCEKTIQMDVEPSQLGISPPHQFHSVNYQLDVFGYCTDCGMQEGRAAGEHEDKERLEHFGAKGE